MSKIYSFQGNKTQKIAQTVFELNTCRKIEVNNLVSLHSDVRSGNLIEEEEETIIYLKVSAFCGFVWEKQLFVFWIVVITDVQTVLRIIDPDKIRL